MYVWVGVDRQKLINLNKKRHFSKYIATDIAINMQRFWQNVVTSAGGRCGPEKRCFGAQNLGWG